MIITHKLPWDKCLSHQLMPAIEKGWKDEGKDVHFFWGLAGQNIRQIKECEERGDEWWYVDVGYLTEQITRYPEPIINNYDNTYFKEVYDVLSKKYKLGRVRILLKEPRSTLSWHRDPEPRLHIPIITNPGCLMVIDNVAKHMPADGSVWVTNNTKYHNAFNGGEENRIHLVACVLDYKFN